MIDFYTWGTPNGRKVSILLEELELPYRVIPINIGAGEQFEARFLDINPNSKIPALVDRRQDTAITIFESGAILIYLAEQARKFLPETGPERYEVLQWLMFQMGGVGPMFGQVHHFLRSASQPVPYAINRYTAEANRLYGVMNNQLASRSYLAGEYSIADMAVYPWVSRHDWQQVELADYPHVASWFARVGERPAVQRGMLVP